MDVWERVIQAAEREMKGKEWMVRWELSSAVPNKWVLSVNINTEIVYWQKPCSTERRGGVVGEGLNPSCFLSKHTEWQAVLHPVS